MSFLPLGLLFPVGLLLLVLLMERVEQPLRRDDVTDQLAEFLAAARPEEVETFVTRGYSEALERYWRRRRLSRLLPGRSR